MSKHRHRRGSWRLHRRKREFPSIIKALALLVVTSVAALWLTCRHFQKARQSALPNFSWQSSSQGSPVGPAIFHGQLTLPADARGAGRVVYPYSVIAGGAHDAHELRQAVATDPVVAAHYAGFNVSRARVVTLRNGGLAYVSYRRGNQIFWTSKKLKIARGEQLLTDGTNYARTRCGNRISPAAHTQAAADEPSPEEFDTPVNLVNLASRGDASLATWSPSSSIASPPAEATAAPVSPLARLPEAPPPALSFPVIPPATFPVIPPSGHKPKGCPKGSLSSKPPCKKRPPAVVPEPGTMLLMATGAAVLGVRKRLRK